MQTEKIADILISSEDEETIWIRGTNCKIEIVDFTEYFLPNRDRLLTFYVREGENYGGVTFNTRQLETWDKEHLRDAFILALN